MTEAGMQSSTFSPETEKSMRNIFRSFNKFMLLLFRLGLGSYVNGTRWGGWIMVLSQVGRKSGLLRRTPLNYALVDGDVYCLAGFGAQADWYRNILANPQVEVWLVEGRWAGIAEDVSDHPQRLDLLRKVLIASGFASYAAGIDPLKLDDEDLDALTQNYRLVRIRRQEARTGPGGPGDLAWVWPLATMILLPLALKKSKPRANK